MVNNFSLRLSKSPRVEKEIGEINISNQFKWKLNCCVICNIIFCFEKYKILITTSFFAPKILKYIWDSYSSKRRDAVIMMHIYACCAHANNYEYKHLHSPQHIHVHTGIMTIIFAFKKSPKTMQVDFCVFVNELLLLSINGPDATLIRSWYTNLIHIKNFKMKGYNVKDEIGLN